MIRRQVRGEMTVFLSLTLMLIAALLFTLVEGARFKCLRSMADMDRVMEAESAFAEYDVALLKEYGLLYLDDSYGTGTENVKRIAERIMTLSESNLNPDLTFGSDLYECAWSTATWIPMSLQQIMEAKLSENR